MSRTATRNAVRQDRVIAGGPEDFMEVRHLVLARANEEIGRALATHAIERFGLEAHASTDRLRTRVQRRYIEMNYPILHDRMRGVAAAFGKRLDDDVAIDDALRIGLQQGEPFQLREQLVAGELDVTPERVVGRNRFDGASDPLQAPDCGRRAAIDASRAGSRSAVTRLLSSDRERVSVRSAERGESAVSRERRRDERKALRSG